MILLIFSFIGIIFIGIGYYMKMMDPVVIETKGYIDKVSYEKTNDPDKYEMIYLYSFKTWSKTCVNVAGSLYPGSKKILFLLG